MIARRFYDFPMDFRILRFEDGGDGPFDICHFGLPRKDIVILRGRAVVGAAAGAGFFGGFDGSKDDGMGEGGGPPGEDYGDVRGSGTLLAERAALVRSGLLYYLEAVGLDVSVHGGYVRMRVFGFRGSILGMC